VYLFQFLPDAVHDPPSGLHDLTDLPSMNLSKALQTEVFKAELEESWWLQNRCQVISAASEKMCDLSNIIVVIITQSYVTIFCNEWPSFAITS